MQNWVSVLGNSGKAFRRANSKRSGISGTSIFVGKQTTRFTCGAWHNLISWHLSIWLHWATARYIRLLVKEALPHGLPRLDEREAASNNMEVLLLLQSPEAGVGEVVKSVAAIGLAPTLLIVALYAYKSRTDATIKHLEDQNKQLLAEILRIKGS